MPTPNKEVSSLSPSICPHCGKRLRDEDVIVSDAAGVIHARCAPRAADRLDDPELDPA